MDRNFSTKGALVSTVLKHQTSPQQTRELLIEFKFNGTNQELHTARLRDGADKKLRIETRNKLSGKQTTVIKLPDVKYEIFS